MSKLRVARRVCGPVAVRAVGQRRLLSDVTAFQRPAIKPILWRDIGEQKREKQRVNGSMTEDELIENIIRIKSSGKASTNAEVHAALQAEGLAVELKDVKKANSKAAKKGLTATATAQVEEQVVVTTNSKKQEKAAKAAVDMMKAAETDMMDKCRRLRIALGEDEYAAVAATQDRGEKFIQSVVARALESKLQNAEILSANGIEARVEADLAVLVWAQMAEKAGTLTLPEEAGEAAAQQIVRLKGVRGATSVDQVKGCFVLPEPEREELGPASGVEYTNSAMGPASTGSIDRLMAKAGMMAVGGDDDVD
jgi:phosphotransferase system IIB component